MAVEVEEYENGIDEGEWEWGLLFKLSRNFPALIPVKTIPLGFVSLRQFFSSSLSPRTEHR